jgi:hypothetical protein
MDEAETTTEELRELIRQGHMLLGDIQRERKAAVKEVDDLIGGLNAKIEEFKNAPKVEVEEVIREITGDAVTRIAHEVSETANECMSLVEKTIYDRFDILMNTLLGIAEQDGSLSIPDLLAARAGGYKPKIDLEGLARVGDPIDRGTS